MKKLILLAATNFTLSCIFNFFTPTALAEIQEVTTEVTAGNITLEPFNDFSLGQAFALPEAQTIEKTFDLDTAGERIRVTDLRNNGEFSVDVTFSDLVDGSGNTVNYESIQILTVTESENTSDAFPASAPADVAGPLDYDWDFSSAIPDIAFTSIPDSGEATSNPITILDGIAPADGGRLGSYTVAPVLKLTIPASLEPGTYTGVMTITLNT